MRTAILLLTTLLICSCGAGTQSSNAPSATPVVSESELNADVDAMRDGYAKRLRDNVENRLPSTFILKGKQEAEQWRAQQKGEAAKAVAAWGVAVEKHRPVLREIARANWNLAAVDRHRLMENKVLERE